MSTFGDAIPNDEQRAATKDIAQPDEALIIRLSAQKLWSEGRANPVWYQCSTCVGIWTTDDRITWRTTDGNWVAQLERSANGRHVSLTLYNQAVYVGRQDASGFHVSSSRAALGDPVHWFNRCRFHWRVRRCRLRDVRTATAAGRTPLFIST